LNVMIPAAASPNRLGLLGGDGAGFRRAQVAE